MGVHFAVWRHIPDKIAGGTETVVRGSDLSVLMSLISNNRQFT